MAHFSRYNLLPVDEVARLKSLTSFQQRPVESAMQQHSDALTAAVNNPNPKLPLDLMNEFMNQMFTKFLLFQKNLNPEVQEDTNPVAVPTVVKKRTAVEQKKPVRNADIDDVINVLPPSRQRNARSVVDAIHRNLGGVHVQNDTLHIQDEDTKIPLATLIRAFATDSNSKNTPELTRIASTLIQGGLNRTKISNTFIKKNAVSPKKGRTQSGRGTFNRGRIVAIYK
jgi:hypothetical protein